MAAKSYKTDAFGPYTQTGTSINSRYPVLPPGERLVIVGATTKMGVAKNEIIQILSGDIDEIVSKVGDESEAPEVFYAARAAIANGVRYIDVVCPSSVGAHLTEIEAITDAVMDAVELSLASLLVVPKPATWIVDGYGDYACAEVDKAFIDLMGTLKHDRMMYIFGLPQGLDVAGAIDYVTGQVNKQSKLAACIFPNAYILDVDGTLALRDMSPSWAGLACKLSREHPRGVAKAPAGSRADYHLAGISRLELDLYGVNDTVKASLQNGLINPVFSHNGIYVFGASTLLADADDVYRHMNITRQISEIKQQVALIADNFIFENTDDLTLDQLKTKCEAYLQTLADSLKIKDSFVRVSIDTVNQSQVNVTIGVKPQYPIEFIVFTVTADTAE